MLDEPTQGIDIGAKIAVYRLINAAHRAPASGVILISSDDEELLAMADRVALVRQGAVAEVSGRARAAQGRARALRRGGARGMKGRLAQELIGPIVATLVVAALVALTTARFLDPGNLGNLALQVSVIGARRDRLARS